MYSNEPKQVNHPDYQTELPVSEPSVSKWLLVTFLSSIPVVGFILLVIWAFDNATNPTFTNNGQPWPNPTAVLFTFPP